MPFACRRDAPLGAPTVPWHKACTFRSGETWDTRDQADTVPHRGDRAHHAVTCADFRGRFLERMCTLGNMRTVWRNTQ